MITCQTGDGLDLSVDWLLDGRTGERTTFSLVSSPRRVVHTLLSCLRDGLKALPALHPTLGSYLVSVLGPLLGASEEAVVGPPQGRTHPLPLLQAGPAVQTQVPARGAPTDMAALPYISVNNLV